MRDNAQARNVLPGLLCCSLQGFDQSQQLKLPVNPSAEVAGFDVRHRGPEGFEVRSATDRQTSQDRVAERIRWAVAMSGYVMKNH